MESKYNKAPQQNHPLTPSSRIRLTTRIVLVYYLTLAGLVWLTIRNGVPLTGAQGLRGPGLWLDLILVYYYVLPVSLAVLLGVMFRPFWPNFRNLLVIVFVIHVLYSFGVSVVRHQYMMGRQARLDVGRLVEFQLKSVKHELTDVDGDGVLDDLDLYADIDLSQLPPGRYHMKAVLVKGNTPVPHGELTTSAFDVVTGASGSLSLHFASKIETINPAYQDIAFNVDFQLMKDFPLDQRGKKILTFSRWAPFFRETAWDGSDQQLRDVSQPVIQWVNTDDIVYQPYGPVSVPVEFSRFAGDFGVDVDNDGLFDYLVITLDVTSHYAGPLYIQAYLTGVSYPRFFPTQVEKGLQTINFGMGGDYLRELAADGPYQFYNFEIFNNDPSCQDKDCISKPKVPFRVKIATPYVTKPYLRDKFETPATNSE